MQGQQAKTHSDVYSSQDKHSTFKVDREINMTLGSKQELFSRMIPLLYLYAQFHGYQIRTGDVFRDPRLHGDIGEKKGYGHKNSAHKNKLAIDVNITKDGVYLQGMAAADAHNFLHNFWDLIGGANRIPHDLNHYSLEHQGMR